jgi:hypothetical protein
MDEHLFVLCFSLGINDDFLHTCGQSELLDGELPRIMVDKGFEGDGG